MIEQPRKLSRATRLALVAGLWLVLLLLMVLAVRNIGWVQSWAGGTLFTCIFLYALLLAFSFVAAAIHLSLDVMQGRYPYPQPYSRPRKEIVRAIAGESSAAGRPATLRTPWYKTVLNVLGVAGVTLALTLVLLEVGLRIFAPQTSPEMRAQLWSTMFVGDPATIYKNRSGVNVTFRLAESTTNWSVNDQGLREDHTIGSPLTGTLRILDIGDSFTFGYGVEQKEAFASLVNGDGGAAGTRIESINAGVSGYGTDNEAAWLHVYGWSYQPNIVLVGFFVGNDVSDVLLNSNHIRVEAGALAITPWDGPPAWEVSTHGPANPAAQGKAWLAANSHAYVFLRAAFNGLIDQFKKPQVRSVGLSDTALMYYKDTPADIEDGWGRVTALLDYMNKETAAHGAKLVVAVIPTREQVEDVYWDDLKTGFGLTEESLERDKPQRLLADWSAASGVPLIDLLPGFRAAQGGPFYFRKDPHWNATGQSLAARLIKEGLLKLGLLGE